MEFRRQVILFSVLAAVDLCLAAGLAGSIRMWRGTGSFPGEKTERAESVSSDMPEQRTGTVALTFDDGPDPVFTAELLDGLKERGVSASFFLIGDSAEKNRDLVRRIHDEGHLVGVHCMKHGDLTKETVEEASKELEKTRECLLEITGSRPEYVRPPYGAWNQSLEDAVDMEPVLWTVDSLDWKLQDPDRVAARVLKTVKDGDIILMHDGFSSSVEAAFRIVDNLQARGYTFVTVDELMID